MERRWFRISVSTVLLAIFIGMLFVALSAIYAQGPDVVDYGTSTVGNISADGASVAFSFTGNSGDLVTVRAIGLTPGMDPNLTLFGPAQEVLVSNDNTPLLPAATDAEIVFRLLTPGSHTLTISGTAGDFLLTLLVRPQVQTTALVFDAPTVAVLPLESANQVFVFNTDPFQATTLLIDSEPFNLNAFIEVRDSTGQLIAVLGGNLGNACLSLGPGDAVNEVMIQGSPEAVGEITFTLSNTPCISAPEPVVFDVQTMPFQPLPIPNVCAASSFVNVNIRSGPGLNYPVISLLLARTPIQVIGISQDGNWYGVQGTNFQGWIVASLTFIVGPCDALPVIQAPPPPALTPTPGVIIVTATPGATETEVTTTPDGTEEPTDEATPEPEETETVVPTEGSETPTGTITITPDGTLTTTPVELTLEATPAS